MLARILGGFKKYGDVLKKGWAEEPYLYGSASLGVCGFIIMMYRTLITPPGGYITRFKERYIVMRPDDDRLIGYPKEYVTDSQLLK